MAAYSLSAAIDEGMGTAASVAAASPGIKSEGAPDADINANAAAVGTNRLQKNSLVRKQANSSLSKCPHYEKTLLPTGRRALNFESEDECIC